MASHQTIQRQDPSPCTRKIPASKGHAGKARVSTEKEVETNHLQIPKRTKTPPPTPPTLKAEDAAY